MADLYIIPANFMDMAIDLVAPAIIPETCLDMLGLPGRQSLPGAAVIEVTVLALKAIDPVTLHGSNRAGENKFGPRTRRNSGN